MAVTQKDIASRLNLSQSLVAGVLNDRPNVWASPETRRRIKRAAIEMDYSANRAARSLRRGKTYVVAFVVSLSESGLGSLVASGIHGLPLGLTALGYDMLWKILPEDDDSLSVLSNMVSGQVCDAFILWGHEPIVELSSWLLPILLVLT